MYREILDNTRWGINHSPLDCYFTNRLPSYHFSTDKQYDRSFFDTNRIACLAIDLTQALIPLVTNLKPKKIDIKVLLKKIRTDEKKEQLGSNVFFGLIAVAVIVTGVIASL